VGGALGIKIVYLLPRFVGVLFLLIIGEKLEFIKDDVLEWNMVNFFED
jgi:hypothetical protein